MPYYRDTMAMEESKTKAERRESRRKSRRKMRVIGRSVRLLLEIVRRRAEKASNRETKKG